ncbi:uncharacterized protein LOC101862063 [Aplysia californica]|uniref:Uncharacterized protein LOC101862063 n=1 Tax=Aplysia californica TaxID=6500 RepID=A0ABM0K269_APLCA|nr:uncharacterized protein LOC101862063 [Aplysia californica]
MLILAFALLLSAFVAESQPSALSSPRTASVDGVVITTSHSQIHEGLTEHLTINCTFTHHQGSNFNTIWSLILSKTDSPSDSVYSEIASITAFSNNKIEENNTMGAFVTGHHKPDAYSFIALEWTFPSSQVEGNYRCEANGMDHRGHPLTSSANVAVAETSVTIDMLLTKMNQMNTKMEDMEMKLTNYTALEKRVNHLDAELNDLMLRVEHSKNAITVASDSYGGSHYIVSKLVWGNVVEANRLCRLYGGYLVEINDRHEYDFVAGFVNKQTHFSGVAGAWIGATDEGHEGTWSFITSGGTMSTFVWHDSEPNGGTEENCMVMWMATKKLNDYPCFESDPKQLPALLCEIPDRVF